MNETIFSVVIPTYNRASKIRRAVESVLAQSYENFEILVMDDGSTDNTAEVVASFADPRITYRWDKNFGGPARPRNRGIALAKGEWICFLDADDWWTVDKLQICFDCINEKVDLVPISIFVNKETAQKLKKIEDKNRVLRNSFFNRLILFLLSTHRTLKRFDIAETMTNKNIHDDWHEDFLQFTGGLDGLENIIRDPLENIRVAFKGESQQDNGLYNTRLPPAYIGFECYLDDEYVPNTKEYQKRIKEENEFADSL